MNSRFPLFPLAAGAVLVAPLFAHAQVIDDVDVFREEGRAVIRVRFTTPVQYVRHAPPGSGDLVKIEFQLVGRTETDVNQLQEYRKVRVVDGLPSFRLSYAASQGNTTVKNLQIRFASPVRFRVQMGGDNRSLRVTVPLPDDISRKAGRVGDLLPPNAPQEGYVITLASGNTPDLNAPPIPAGLQDYTVFTERRGEGTKTVFSLRLGFFATKEEAEKVRAGLVGRFPKAVVTALVAPRPATAPAGEAPAPGAPAAAPALAEGVPTPAEIDEQAALGLARARSALQAGQPAIAVDFLNQVLTLPPNKHSREAQAIVGHARAANGEPAKARIEYELYLTLYPEGPEAPSVKESLAALGKAPAPGTPEAGGAPPSPFTVSGSLTQSYNRGATKAETDTRVDSTSTGDKATFQGVDQSALVSNVDLNARLRTTDYDQRFVFRDTNVKNRLQNARDSNQVSAAYYEVKSLPGQWNARLGRQTATSSGVLGRFDGLQASIQVAPVWRLGAVAGKPVEFTPFESQRRFAGLTAEFGPFLERWSGSAFAIGQRIDGITDRRAVGGDLRYFDANSSLYSLLDYDTHFRELGIFLIQGTRSFEGGWSLTGLYDHRKAPPLQTSNALLGGPTTSMKALLTTLSREEVEALARARTAESKQGFVGLTKQFNPTWQAGVDLRYSNIGALPPSGDLPATPSTGNVYTASFQLTGSNLIGRRDISVLNLSSTHGPTLTGHGVAANHLEVLAERWTVEPSLRYYRQTDNLDVLLRRFSPSLRISFRPVGKVSLDSEFAWEDTRTEGPSLRDHTRRHFISVGYRWDF